FVAAHRTARARFCGVTASWSPSSRPSVSSRSPHRMPLVPPARSPNAVPAARSTAPTPPSAISAASTAARAPLLMPMPWSPSPATASISPSRSRCSQTVVSSTPTSRRTTCASRRDSSLAATACATVASRLISTRSVKRCSTAALPRRNDAVSAGARHQRSRSSSSHVTDNEQPAMSRLVTIAPPTFEIVVEPRDRQRTTGHVQTRDELSHLGLDEFDALRPQPRLHLAPQKVELLVLGCAQPVQQHRGATVGVGRALGEYDVDESFGQVARRHRLSGVDPGLAE